MLQSVSTDCLKSVIDHVMQLKHEIQGWILSIQGQFAEVQGECHEIREESQVLPFRAPY